MANIKQVNINDTLYDIEALKATQDGSGNVIADTYATKGDVSKVEQKAAITTDGEYPVILSATTDTTAITDAVNKTSTLKYNPSTGVLTAPTFQGGLTTNGGNIILDSVNYSATLPSSASDGQLFFLDGDPFPIPAGGTKGQILIKNSTTDGDYSWTTPPYLSTSGGTVSGTVVATTFTGNLNGNATTATNATTAAACTGNSATATNATNASKIYSSASTSKAYILGTTTASSANHATVYNASVYTSGSVLYGAAWNDYAEYRICNDNFIPGQVVCENGDDTLSISTRRMQPGANIISDTFGFAIGETENAKCPIAVSGRVLAYTYESREEFKPGEAVCAGPNGTVSHMTREEIREYPECIIGTVSAIPEYDTWGENNILVNNRIWIKI